MEKVFCKIKKGIAFVVVLALVFTLFAVPVSFAGANPYEFKQLADFSNGSLKNIHESTISNVSLTTGSKFGHGKSSLKWSLSSKPFITILDYDLRDEIKADFAESGGDRTKAVITFRLYSTESSGEFTVTACDKNGNVGLRSTDKLPNSSTITITKSGWQDYTCSFTTYMQKNVAAAGFKIEAVDGSGEIFFDSIWFERVKLTESPMMYVNSTSIANNEGYVSKSLNGNNAFYFEFRDKIASFNESAVKVYEIKNGAEKLTSKKYTLSSQDKRLFVNFDSQLDDMSEYRIVLGRETVEDERGRLLGRDCSVAFAVGKASKWQSVINLFDFNDTRSFIETQSVRSNSNTKDGNAYSIDWNNHTSSGLGKSELKFPISPNVASKLSDYERIRMWIHSEKATNATIKVIFWDGKTPAGNSQYFHKNFVVDWTGWKCVEMNTNSFTVTQNALWDEVTDLRIIANGGWNLTGDAQTHLYVATADIISFPTENTLELNYSSAMINDVYTALESSAAYYAGSSNAVTSEGVVQIEAEAILSDNDVLIPASEFSQRFGAEITLGANSLSVSLNGNTAVLKTESLLEKDGITYLNGCRTAKLLGLSAYSLNEFLVIGSQSCVKTFENSGGIGVNQFREIASYLAKHKDRDDGDISLADVEAVKENWRRYLVGNSEINDMSNPNIKNAVDTYTKEAKDILEVLNTNSSSSPLFSDLNIKGSAEVEVAYKRIWSLAKAYGCHGSELYHKSDLAAKILYAMEYMYQNYFGIHQINGDSTWKEDIYNWADYDLDCGRCLVYTMLILTEVEGNITEDDIEKYMAYYEKRNPNPTKTGMNYAEITINLLGSAVLKGDIQRMRKLINGFETMYFYTDDQKRFTESGLSAERQALAPIRGMGFYTDGSYILHTMMAYNAVYGQRHMKALCMMNSILGGTKFMSDSPEIDNLDNIIFDNFESHTAFGTTGFRMLQGRVQSTPLFTGGLYFAPVMDCLTTLDENTQNKIKSIAKKAVQNSSSLKGWYNNLSLEGISIFDSILADSSVEPRSNKYRSKVYAAMDKSVHEQGDWAVGISMHSARTFNYECINQQNLKGWYLSDGMTEFHLEGDTKTSSNAYWNSMNYYRLPGTTVDTQKREEVSVALKNAYFSSKDFVGGATLDGKYGVSAMHLESYHSDEPIGDASVSAFGGGANPAHKNDLTAKKAYFMFDEEVVCLGSDVTASNNNNAEVLTVVDNKMAYKINSSTGYGADKIISDLGTLALTDADTNMNGAKWINFADKFGYYFFNDTAYSDSNLKARQTKGDSSYFELWLSHGVNPANGKYAYAVLPSKTSSETKAYSENPNVEILANNSSVQAVRNTKLGITGIVFHEPGTLGNITADKPCIVICKNSGGELEISVSDPTQKLEIINLELDGSYFITEADKGVEASAVNSKTKITVDTKNSLGKTYSATFTDELVADPVSTLSATRAKATSGCTENLRPDGATSYTKVDITGAYPVIDLNIKKDGKDISFKKDEYKYLNMWIYSPYPQAGGLILAYNGSGNYMHSAPEVLNWSGWKLLSVPVDSIDISSVTLTTGNYQGFGTFRFDKEKGSFLSENSDRIFSKLANNWHSEGSFGIENVWFSKELPEGANEDPAKEDYKGETPVAPKVGELVLFDSANAVESSEYEYSTHIKRRNLASAVLSDFGRAYALITWDDDKSDISKVSLTKTQGKMVKIWSGDAVDIISDYSYINLWLYSPGVKYDQFGNYSEYIVNFTNKDNQTATVGIPANWTGWKLVSIPVSGFSGTYLSRMKKGIVQIDLTANQNCAQWANGTNWTGADLEKFTPDYGDANNTTWLSREVAGDVDYGIDAYGRYNTFGDVETYFGLERMWLSKSKPDADCEYISDGKTVSAEITQNIIAQYGSDMALVVASYSSANPDKLLYVTLTPYEAENKITVDYTLHKTYSSDIKAMLWDMKTLKPIANAVEIK